VEIAKRCDFQLPLGKHRFPVYPLDNGETAEDRLERMAREGLDKRYGRHGPSRHRVDRKYTKTAWSTNWKF
jgi:DNA polymerase III alpha subunit